MKVANWIKQAFTPKPAFEEKDWIDVSLNLLWDVIKNNSYDVESKISDIAQDVGNIFINTKIVINNNNQYIGTVNPYLGITSVLSCAKATEEYTLYPLSAFYVVQIKKNIGGKCYHISENKKKKVDAWKIELKPYVDAVPKKFKLYEYNFELYGLDYISKWICERYNISIEPHGFNPILINGQPAIVELENANLLTKTYLIEDRIKYGELNNPKLDKFCFSASVLENIDIVRKNKLLNKNITPDYKETGVWLSEADKLIMKYNL